MSYLEDMERVAGGILAFALVFFVVVLRSGLSWWLMLPGAFVLVGIVFMGRVKLAQRAMKQFKENCAKQEEKKQKRRFNPFFRLP